MIRVAKGARIFLIPGIKDLYRMIVGHRDLKEPLTVADVPDEFTARDSAASEA